MLWRRNQGSDRVIVVLFIWWDAALVSWSHCSNCRTVKLHFCCCGTFSSCFCMICCTSTMKMVNSYFFPHVFAFSQNKYRTTVTKTNHRTGNAVTKSKLANVWVIQWSKTFKFLFVYTNYIITQRSKTKWLRVNAQGALIISYWLHTPVK